MCSSVSEDLLSHSKVLHILPQKCQHLSLSQFYDENHISQFAASTFSLLLVKTCLENFSPDLRMRNYFVIGHIVQKFILDVVV